MRPAVTAATIGVPLRTAAVGLMASPARPVAFT